MEEQQPKPRTIDERIEALTHSVELLASLYKDRGDEIRRVEKQISRLGKYIRSVSHIVLDHEARIRAIEGNGNGTDHEEADE